MHCYHRFWHRESFTADKRRVWSWALLVVAIALLLALNLQTSSRQTLDGSDLLKTQSSSGEPPKQLPTKTGTPSPSANKGEANLSSLQKRDLLKNVDIHRSSAATLPPLTESELKQQVAVAKQEERIVEKINQQQQAILSDQLRAQPAEIQSLLKTDISYRVEQWRLAWQSGNSERYLTFYDASYLPTINTDGLQLSIEAWRQHRIARVIPERNIQLKLSNFQVEFAKDNTQALVSFDLEYQSNSYQDVSRKELTFTSRGDQWYIVAERTKTQ